MWQARDGGTGALEQGAKRTGASWRSYRLSRRALLRRGGLAAAGLAALPATLAAALIAVGDKASVAHRVSVAGVALGGTDREGARRRLAAAVRAYLTRALDVRAADTRGGMIRWSVIPTDLGLAFDLEAALVAARQRGDERGLEIGSRTSCRAAIFPCRWRWTRRGSTRSSGPGPRPRRALRPMPHSPRMRKVAWRSPRIVPGWASIPTPAARRSWHTPRGWPPGRCGWRRCPSRPGSPRRCSRRSPTRWRRRSASHSRCASASAPGAWAATACARRSARASRALAPLSRSIPPRCTPCSTGSIARQGSRGRLPDWCSEPTGATRPCRGGRARHWTRGQPWRRSRRRWARAGTRRRWSSVRRPPPAPPPNSPQTTPGSTRSSTRRWS